MALSFRHIRAALRHIRQGYLLDHPGEAGARAAMLPAYQTISDRLTADQGYNPLTRHSAWTIGDYRSFKYQRRDQSPTYNEVTGQRTGYSWAWNSRGDTLGSFVHNLASAMSSDAYERKMTSAADRKSYIERHVREYQDEPAARAASARYRGTPNPELRGRVMRRSDAILLPLYEGGNATAQWEAFAYILNRLNRHYARRGYANAAPLTRVLAQGREAAASLETVRHVAPLARSERGIPREGFALFWIEGSYERTAFPGVSDALRMTCQLKPMWMLRGANRYGLPSQYANGVSLAQPVLDGFEAELVLTDNGDIRQCSATRAPWYARHMYRGADRPSSSGRSHRFYSPFAYNVTEHGGDPHTDEHLRRQAREQRRRNPDTRARLVNIEDGALLNYSDSPLHCWPAPGWYGHNGPTDGPERRTLQNGRERGIRYLGVELEVGYPIERESGRPPMNWTRESAVKWTAQKLENFAILKSDGSIGSVQGAEIVTRPAVLSQQVRMWQPFFEGGGAAKHWGGFIHNVCGMHVHVSKDALTPLQLGRMIVFVNAQETRELVTRIAGRGSNTYSQITPKTLQCGLGYERDIRNRYGEIVDRRPRFAGTAEGRYAAINLETGKGTVEFRIFKSNVSAPGFFKNVEFVDALCVWAGEAGNRALTAEAFCAFVEGRAKAYPHLCAWLRKAGYLKDTTPDDAAKRESLALLAARTWLQGAAA